MAVIQNEIRDRLLELGIQPNLSGYRSLVLAVEMYHDDPGQAITKEIYPGIGLLCKPEKSAAQIERQIRYAIISAWDRGAPALWDRLFPFGQRPTNAEFIARMSELLADWEEKGGDDEKMKWY